jgi:hypothetical protein
MKPAIADNIFFTEKSGMFGILLTFAGYYKWRFWTNIVVKINMESV